MRYKIFSIPQWFKLPALCALCNQYHPGIHAICDNCLELFRPIGFACYQCALPIADETFQLCGQCSKKKPYHDYVLAPYRFEEPLRTILHEFKYNEGLYFRSFLANLIIRAVSIDACKTECLIPVPLHLKRLQYRGFNQAAELTKYLSRQLKIPYDLTLCKKIINTRPQAELDSKKRHKNLHKAFAVNSTSYQHVTLIDDLMTTGNTVNEIAKTFKNHGVKRVDVWCCARALRDIS